MENKSKFLLVHYLIFSHPTLSSDTLCYIAQVHSSSGHKHSLKEVLSDPAASVRLADTKVCIYTGLLTELMIRELYCIGYRGGKGFGIFLFHVAT